MKLFDLLTADDFEQVFFCYDEISNLCAIAAIHDTTLGPALAGVRIQPYETEILALTDVMNLAKMMTLKTSAAGLNLGGGKAVIIADPKTQKTEALLRSFGRFVESLCGRIYIGEGLGSTVEDIETISQETRYVTGLQRNKGGGGNPSPKTAYGTYKAILGTEQDAERLHNSGITYAPDFIANAGGLINLAEELLGYNEERVSIKVEKVYDTILHIIRESRANNVSTHSMAVEFARDRIRVIREVKRTFLPEQNEKNDKDWPHKQNSSRKGATLFRRSL